MAIDWAAGGAMREREYHRDYSGSAHVTSGVGTCDIRVYTVSNEPTRGVGQIHHTTSNIWSESTHEISYWRRAVRLY